MLPRIAPRRGGFSLIELLVVISIIAVLMGLLLSAIQKVREVGPRTDTTARIAAINNAIGAFKSNQSFGNITDAPIPPGAFNFSTNQWGPFQLRDSYGAPGTTQPDINSFEAQYIIQVFGVRPTLNSSGQPQIVTLGNPGLNKTLDANQTLTFFLTGIPVTDAQGNATFTGFSTNSQAPFTPRGAPDEARRANGPLLDLGGGSKKKYALGAGGMAVLIDGFGNPFVYFAAYNGKMNKYSNGGANSAYSNTLGQPMGTPIPYSRNGQFENPSGFQIISAGRDGIFGTTGNWNNVGPTGMDDQANFTDRLLGAGPK